MKKYIYAQATCLAFCQSVQAFDMFEDEEGFKAVHFKKTEETFSPDIEKFMQDPEARNIQQIYFDESISYDDQVKVFDDLCNRLNLVHVGNESTAGFLENATLNQNMVYFTTQLKTFKSRTLRNLIDLDLQSLIKPQFNYLPFFRK